MTKLNAKAIREEARKEFARKHNKELERLREENKSLRVKINASNESCYKVSHENEKLKEQIEAQKEWIERLMDFVNMPDDERSAAIKKYVETKKMSEEFKELFAPYFNVLNRLNNIFSI